jgi:GT2 family glycosyltransferase
MPTMRRRDELTACLDALAEQTIDRGLYEVILADDAAGEDPSVRPAPDWVRNVRATVPGASAARNAGWRAAEGSVVVFIDDDIRVRPNLLERHLRHHESDPDERSAMLGRVEWAPELEITPFMRWADDGVQFDYSSIGKQAQWWHLYTCNSSVKRSMLEKVGGFDEENFPFLYEDLDLARRMSDHGLRVTFDPDAVVDHLVPITLESFIGRLPRLARSEWAWVHKWPEFPPYFYNKLVPHEEGGDARGGGIKLLRWVPRWVPLAGPYVWKSADYYYMQALAPHFMKVWRELEALQSSPAE